MKALINKNILLLSPKFFGYEKQIEKKLKEFGANVTYFDERPKNNLITKSLIRLNSKILIKKTIDNYYKIIIDKASTSIDYLLLINPETIREYHLKEIVKKNQNIKIIVYMWDSLQNKRYNSFLIKYAKSFFTFDNSDSKINPNIKFLPLFYCDDYSKLYSLNKKEYKYQSSFIGTIHSNRYEYVNKVLKYFDKESFVFFYSPSKILFFFQKLAKRDFKKVRLKDISFKSLEKSTVLKIINETNIIIDIEHPKQNGLTMRTVETLGAGKKLITTNAEVSKYDFYNPNNIHIVDRYNPVIDKRFIKIPFENIPPEIRKKYTLSSWLIQLLS